jgi:hypothetical protein
MEQDQGGTDVATSRQIKKNMPLGLIQLHSGDLPFAELLLFTKRYLILYA